MRVGETLAGRYDIQRQLADNGLAMMFVAWDRVLERQVTLQVPPRDMVTDLWALQQLKQLSQKVRLCQQLEHEGICATLGFHEDAREPFVVMEYVEGVSLADLIFAQPGRKFDEARCRSFAEQILAAVGYAHSQGVVHQSLSTANIMVTAAGRIQIINFPTVASWNIPQFRSAQHGAAPAQARAGWSAWSVDIYSLGCVFYEMLSGESLPVGRDVGQQWRRSHGPISGVSNSLNNLIRSCLENDPARRPESIAAIQLFFATEGQQATMPLSNAAVRSSRLDDGESEPLAPRSVPSLQADASMAVTQTQSSPKPPSFSLSLTRRGVSLKLGVGIVGLFGLIAIGMFRHFHLTAPSNVKQNDRDGQRYVYIPAGKFRMGCSVGDSECDDDEKPVREVVIEKGFWIGETEVTVAAYKRFATATRRTMPAEPKLGSKEQILDAGWSKATLPIVNVEWSDASAYCSWIGGRVPSEAEWEYAARGGVGESRYGDLKTIAWMADNSGSRELNTAQIWASDETRYGEQLSENQNRFHPVRQKLPNRYGLYDMLGNVWEWTADWYTPSEEEWSLVKTRVRPDEMERTLRGGSWFNFPRFVRASKRNGVKLNEKNHSTGFRCLWN